MSKNYDLIANVNISIKSPIADETSFDHVLLVGPLPKTPSATPPKAYNAYFSLDEVIKCGWKVDGDDADPIGKAAQLAFAQTPRPNVIYIAPQQTVEENDEQVVESAVATITRANAYSDWYVVCTAGVPKTQYAAIAAYIETQKKMFAFVETDFFAQASGGKPIVSGELYRTICIFGCETADQTSETMPDVNNYLALSWVCKWLKNEPGSETAAYHTISGAKPVALSKVDMDALNKENVSYLAHVGSRDVVIGGATLSGEWADIIRFRDWLENDMQERVANLFIEVSKIPYTDKGIALIQNQMLASLKEGQNKGGIAEDEYDGAGKNIPGYSTSVPRASDISPAAKKSRKLTGMKFKARLSGAVHLVNIEGSLTYEL